MAYYLNQLIEKNLHCFRKWSLKLKGVQFNNSVKIGRHIRVNSYQSFFEIDKGEIIIGPQSKISDGVILDTYGGKITIGQNVFLGPYSIIYGHGNVTIGDDTLIAMGCKIISANHQIPSEKEKIRLLPDILGEVNIGCDVWLGADVKILSGVKIGNGCIVGAGSVVTKDLEPYTIAVGSPAMKIGHRPKNKD